MSAFRCTYRGFRITYPQGQRFYWLEYPGWRYYCSKLSYAVTEIDQHWKREIHYVEPA